MTETILQFGTGRFLRGFFDRFVQNAADAGQHVGRIAVVQSIGRGGPESPDLAKGWRVRIRGLTDGKVVDRTEFVNPVSRVIPAADGWDEILALARSPALRLVVSNTTEAGFVLEPRDSFDSSPPVSFPGKLTRLLAERRNAGLSGLTVLPCELLENNGAALRALVLRQAELWELGTDFRDWAERACVWLDTLVDCIVTRPSEPLPGDDAATVQAEPYALLAIAGGPGTPEILRHPCVVRVPDLSPYYLRKVRILNGLHTAMAALWLPAGMTTVGEVMASEIASTEINALLRTEILPVLADRVPDAESFAADVLDRFRNPFLTHRLADIAANHELKKSIRLRPTFDEYVAKFGGEPPILKRILGAGAPSPAS